MNPQDEERVAQGLSGPELKALLEEAFPREGGRPDGTPLCLWCGKTRRPHAAVCVGCWLYVLTDGERRQILTLGTVSRAHWIIEHKPKPKEATR